MSQRLLLNFSYIGTSYRGLQRVFARSKTQPDLESVQGIIEFGLTQVLRIKECPIIISSRTDKGVHAISTIAHFDYYCEGGNPSNTTSPEQLCERLNDFLGKNLTDIRIKRIVQVEDNTLCRKAIRSRTYCYRLAVIKPNENFCIPYSPVNSSLLPIIDLNRYEVVPQPFDADAIFQAIKIFLGNKNFRSFSKVSKENEDLPTETINYCKTIHRVSLSKVNNPDILSGALLDQTANKFDFYDFHFEGSGFLRRQVRKMVGVLLGIGNGKINVQDIQYMLDNPSEKNWPKQCNAGTGEGLFLKSVQYPNLPVVRGFLS